MQFCRLNDVQKDIQKQFVCCVSCIGGLADPATNARHMPQIPGFIPCVLCYDSGLSAALMFLQTQCQVLSGLLQQLGGRLQAAGGRSAGASCGAEGAEAVAEAALAALPTGRPKLPTWSSRVCNSLAMYGMRAPSCL